MMKKQVAVLALMGSMVGTGWADHHATSVGYVDVQSILQSSAQVKSMRKALHERFEKRHGALLADQKALRSDVERFRKDGSVMKAKEKDALRHRIVEREKAFNKAQMAFSKDVMKAQEQGMKRVIAKLRAVVEHVAKRHDMSMVVTKAVTVYGDAHADLTAEVKSELG